MKRLVFSAILFSLLIVVPAAAQQGKSPGIRPKIGVVLSGGGAKGIAHIGVLKALEEEGIGRPSTYASIIQTLVFRNYVNRERGYFRATELGMQISDLLVEYFSQGIID